MAIGLPCIGSRVGGIPELLDKNMLVPPGDAQALTDKIIELIQHPELANVQAELNLTKAHEYADEVLKQKRFEFFRAIQHHSSYNDSKTPNTNILYNRTGL
jgi:glycosyltransferase involved in cell wall biosynthesis